MFKEKFKLLFNAVRDNLFIFTLIAICVAIVISTCSVALCLRNSVDNYFNENNVADVIINSNDGFTANDVDLIYEQTSADIIGVFYAECRYTLGENTSSVTAFSKERNIKDDDIISGKNITAPNECIAIKDADETRFSIGDKIILESDSIRSNEFTVVGIAEKNDTDFENAIILDNSAFSLNYYNRLMLSCDFLHRDGYNTFSDKYENSVADVISRLDNIAINRLTAIKNGDYDYRLLNIAKYDEKLSDEVKQIYSKKDELEELNRELSYVKSIIDQTDALIKEKSDQLAISSDLIYETIGVELKAHEEELKKLTALKESVDKLNDEYKQLESNLDSQNNAVNDSKTQLDSIADKSSTEYTDAKAKYDELVKMQTEIKNDADKKKAEYTKKKSEYDTQYSKYESAYSASKETYDKLMNDTGISSQEIIQMSLTNLNAQAEYNQKLEAYNADYAEMLNSQKSVVQSVNSLYSSYAKLWYFSDRTILKEYINYGSIADVLDIVSLSAFLLSVVVVIYVTATRFDSKCKEIRIVRGFNIALFKGNAVRAVTLSLLGLAVGVALGLVLTSLTQFVFFLLTCLDFTMPILNLAVMLETFALSVLSVVTGLAFIAFKPVKQQ